MTLTPFVKKRAFATLWTVSALERFGFFGIKGMLLLYMIRSLNFTDTRAYGIIGGMMTIAFATPLLGGWMADKFLGNYRMIVLGALISVLGGALFFIPSEIFFFLAVSALVLGNGLVRSSLATLVGKFFQNDDRQRDSIFTLLYLSFNLGALLGMIFCAMVGETYGWIKGFSVAFGVYVGALLLLLFAAKILNLKGGIPPTSTLTKSKILQGGLLFCGIGIVWLFIFIVLEATVFLSFLVPVLIVGTYAVLLRLSYKISPEVGRSILVLFTLTLFQIIFFALYEQGSSSVILFADRNVDRSFVTAFGITELDLFDRTMKTLPTTFFNGIDPFFNLVFGGFFVWFWKGLDRLKLNPMEPYKFSFALILAAFSFAILWYSRLYDDGTGKVSLWWTVFAYGTIVIAELCLAPFSMSLVVRLAPPQYMSIAMGSVFLSFSASQWFASLIARMTAEAQGFCEAGHYAKSLHLYCDAFGQLVLWSLGAGLVLLLISPFFRGFFRKQKLRTSESS